MRIKDSTIDKLTQCRDLLKSIIDDERGNHDNPVGSDEDKLRYYLFMLCMEDAVKGVNKTHSAATMTDEEVHKMCDEAGVTVKGATENAKANMMFKVVSAIFGGGFAPPSTDKEV